MFAFVAPTVALGSSMPSGKVLFGWYPYLSFWLG